MRIPTPTAAAELAVEKRRSMRVHICMPVLVRGTVGDKPFEETTATVLVSAHGCMISLAAKVSRSDHVSIVNIKTAEELDCTVSYIGQNDSGKADIGVEFVEYAPVFWRIVFPPDRGDPSERKRPSVPDAPPITRK